MTANMERWRAEQARDNLQKAFQDQGRELGRLRDLVQSIYQAAHCGADLSEIRGLVDEHDRNEKDHAQRIQAARDAAHGDLGLPDDAIVTSPSDPDWGF